MQKEKYGFVYIWRDRKNNRFYIGCHWGREDDGYICSSDWMRHAYKRRPEDFKRRILKRVNTNRRDLLIEEQKWLDLVPKEELGKKYFNFSKYVLHNSWWTDPKRAKTVGKRISQAPHRRERISKSLRGRKLSKEHIEKLRQLNHDGKIGMLGRQHKNETKQIMKRKNTKELNPWFGKHHNNESLNKIRNASIGRKHTEETIIKFKKNASQRPTTYYRNFISAGNSIESIIKRVAKFRGQKRTLEQRAKMRLAHLGKKQSEDTKQKMKASQLARWQQRKCR